MRLLGTLATLLAVAVFGHALYVSVIGCDWSADTAGQAAGDVRACAEQLNWQTIAVLALLLLGAIGIAFSRQLMAWGGALAATVLVVLFDLGALLPHAFLMMVAAFIWQLGLPRPRLTY